MGLPGKEKLSRRQLDIRKSLASRYGDVRIYGQLPRSCCSTTPWFTRVLSSRSETNEGVAVTGLLRCWGGGGMGAAGAEEGTGGNVITVIRKGHRDGGARLKGAQ